MRHRANNQKIKKKKVEHTFHFQKICIKYLAFSINNLTEKGIVFSDC